MSIRCGGLLALVINASVICRTVAAQQPRSNTTLVRTVVEGTLARIAPELTDFVFRQQPEPWRLVSPDTTDSLWMVAFRGLRELLHAQAPRPTSDHEPSLEVREQPPAVDRSRCALRAARERGKCCHPDHGSTRTQVCAGHEDVRQVRRRIFGKVGLLSARRRWTVRTPFL